MAHIPGDNTIDNARHIAKSLICCTMDGLVEATDGNDTFLSVLLKRCMQLFSSQRQCFLPGRLAERLFAIGTGLCDQGRPDPLGIVHQFQRIHASGAEKALPDPIMRNSDRLICFVQLHGDRTLMVAKTADCLNCHHNHLILSNRNPRYL